MIIQGLLLAMLTMTGTGHVTALHEGATGQAVIQLQTELSNEGLYNSKVDGVFGPITENGVKQFQTEEGITYDGIVGKQTASKLDDAQKTQPKLPQQKTITVVATAYTATGGAGQSGTTYTGINLLANPNAKVIAVDPNIIPLGTKVYVPGYGEAVAGDTGGAIKGNRIDLFMANEQDALNFGMKTIQVTILS